MGCIQSKDKFVDKPATFNVSAKSKLSSINEEINESEQNGQNTDEESKNQDSHVPGDTTRPLPNLPGPGQQLERRQTIGLKCICLYHTQIILKALYDFKPRQPDDLALKKYDRMELISEDTSEELWLQVKHVVTGQIGYVPSNYVVSDNNDPQSQDWWFEVDRREADKQLTLPQNQNGTFMVRASSDIKSYALSVRMVNKKKVEAAGIKHYRIRLMDDHKHCYISPKRKFASVVELIDHYKVNQDGLCCRLTVPCAREPAIVPFKQIEVERGAVKIHTKLGCGMFGEVWQGKWRNQVDVAVKTLKPGSMSTSAFLEEAKIMHKLRHPKLVQLMGVCTQQEPIYIITELMENGALLDYLVTHKDKIPFNAIVDMAAQIASGMSYLEEKSFIHRDVRAANMLVGKNNTVKVADFGLARIVQDDEYTAHAETKFPIKWTAPEAAFDRQFTIKSDVWSYGVLLFEMVTRGSVPYPGMGGQEVLRRVEQGYRMPHPDSSQCPDSLYEMMLKCWDATAANRPTFSFLYDFFDDYFVSTERSYDSF